MHFQEYTFITASRFVSWQKYTEPSSEDDEEDEDDEINEESGENGQVNQAYDDEDANQNPPPPKPPSSKPKRSSSAHIQNLSRMFSLIEMNKQFLNIESYYISQTTLEQLFMSFANRSFQIDESQFRQNYELAV